MGTGNGKETEPIRISARLGGQAFPGEELREEKPPAGMPALPGWGRRAKFISYSISQKIRIVKINLRHGEPTT
jgi:hypothetical protein